MPPAIPDPGSIAVAAAVCAGPALRAHSPASPARSARRTSLTDSGRRPDRRHLAQFARCTVTAALGNRRPRGSTPCCRARAAGRQPPGSESLRSRTRPRRPWSPRTSRWGSGPLLAAAPNHSQRYRQSSDGYRARSDRGVRNRLVHGENVVLAGRSASHAHQQSSFARWWTVGCDRRERRRLLSRALATTEMGSGDSARVRTRR